MYVLATVTPNMSKSKGRIQWTLVIANMVFNKFLAISYNFQSFIYGNENVH